MAGKQPPREFDPHPGDPWHPDWSLEDATSSDEVVDETDGSWWNRVLGRREADGDPSTRPQAYAALEPPPESADVEPEAAPDTPVARAPEPVVETTPDGPVTRVPESEIVDRLAAQLEQEWSRFEQDWSGVEPEPAPPPGVARADREPRFDPLFEPFAAAATATPEPEPEINEEALAAAVVGRAGETQARLTTDAALLDAELSAHEEARMWIAVGMMRAEEEALSAAAGRLEQRKAEREAERRAALDTWAAEALAIEQARLAMEESRKQAEAAVRTTLDQPVRGLDAASGSDDIELDASEIALRFAAIAAELEAAKDAEQERSARREELRLHTSLVELDAEQPWEGGGWTRPGEGFSRGGPAGSRGPFQQAIDPDGPIATASLPIVPESSQRRRWPWAHKRDTPAAPNGVQESLRTVVLVEERPVSDQTGDMADEGQEALPLDDDRAAISSGDDFDLEDDLAAWSDLDWDMDATLDSPNGHGAEVETADEEGTAAHAPNELTDPLNRGATIVFGTPDDSPNGSPDDLASPDTWESFSAADYVQTATHEYADLAAAVAAAEEAEAPEQAAIAADMPGLESNLVGLEDVVAAEGLDSAAEAAGRSDLAIRVVTALGLVTLFFASLTYRWSIGTLVLVVMGLAAFEVTSSLLNAGHHPVGLFIYLATLGILLGTAQYGPVAIPVTVAATLLVVVLFFGLVTDRHAPLTSMALTLTVVLWVGVFGAFAMDIVQAAEYRWLVASVVIVVAAMDIAQYFAGKRFGKRKLAPIVSPKKTVAGLVGGVIVATAMGFGLSFPASFDAPTGVALGAALAVSGPIGDLAVSVLKRSLGVKDMGTILPGHGGVVDRIDAILFSLPAAWFVYSWAGLLV